MAGINKVMIIGRLGADPEVKSVGQGSTVATLNIATSETWAGKDGQKQERTEWHRVVAWGKLAEICGKHLAKGRQVYVEGRLQTRQWEDPQGQKKYTTEIIAQTVQFLGSASGERGAFAGGSNAGANTGAGAGNSSAATGMGSQNNGNNDFLDFGPEPQFNSSEEIPF
jgi:single-strand DNA-binding protein